MQCKVWIWSRFAAALSFLVPMASIFLVSFSLAAADTMRRQTSDNPRPYMVGQASGLPFVTSDSDPAVAPASLPATRKQPERRPVLDTRVRGYDDR